MNLSNLIVMITSCFISKKLIFESGFILLCIGISKDTGSDALEDTGIVSEGIRRGLVWWGFGMLILENAGIFGAALVVGVLGLGAEVDLKMYK